jgi:transposase
MVEVKENVKRYYLGVDWADKVHQVWVSDAEGDKVAEMKVAQSPEGMSELSRWLHEHSAQGIELWAAIEKPEGRIVDFLLDHAVVLYPINPKAIDRARDRFRMSGAKSDVFDAFVLSEFLRTDHGHLKALRPNSEQAQELKMLTRDHHRLVAQRTRVLNQLVATLKEYYPRPLDLFDDLSTNKALDFIKQCPTPEAVNELSRKQWKRFARAHRFTEDQTEELWKTLKAPQLPVPQHVVRAKAKLVAVLVDELELMVKATSRYAAEVQRFFASMPAAKLVSGLPGAKTGTTLASLWAEVGDAPGRWQSFRHLQAQAGSVPLTKESGKSRVVQFRFSCNKRLRHAVYWLAFTSLNQSEWAKAYYRAQRSKGHTKHQSLRALGAKWLKIIFVLWRDHKPYDENYHLANITRQRMRQAA